VTGTKLKMRMDKYNRDNEQLETQ